MNQISDKQKYTEIEQDVLLLKESMEIMQTLVYEQQDTLDTIEDAIFRSKNDVIQGETQFVDANTVTYNYTYGAIGLIGTILGLIVLF